MKIIEPLSKLDIENTLRVELNCENLDKFKFDVFKIFIKKIRQEQIERMISSLDSKIFFERISFNDLSPHDFYDNLMLRKMQKF